MTLESIGWPLFGGALIGLSVTLMLFFNGRVTGISGIIAGALRAPADNLLWRVTFILGMFVGGILLHQWNPDFFVNSSGRDIGVVALAGLLVGYGTVMGDGCTSGHGVCGISRFSVRSITATIVFMFFGFLSVGAFRLMAGGGQ